MVIQFVLHLQHNRWVRLDFEGLGDCSESCAIDLTDADIGVDQGLSDLRPNRFNLLAVGAPGGIELDEPVAIVPHLQEPVAELEYSGTDCPVAQEEYN